MNRTKRAKPDLQFTKVDICKTPFKVMARFHNSMYLFWIITMNIITTCNT